MSEWTASPRRAFGAHGAGAPPASQSLALKAVDLGLILIIIVAPFFMGGRMPLGQTILCALSTLTVVAWCVHQYRHGDGKWRFTGVEPILLLGLGLIALQCMPLSPELLRVISPELQSLLPEWASEAESSVAPGTWNRISVTPNETWSNFIVIVSCSLVFFIGVQRIRTLDDVRRVLRWAAVAGAVMATFGLVQLIFSNGKFYWFYRHCMADTNLCAKGGFTNANHFTSFLAMTLPAQLYEIVTRLHAKRTSPERHAPPSTRPIVDKELFIWTLAIMATCLGILMSLSRGGIIVTICSVALMMLVLWRKSQLGTHVAAAFVVMLTVAFGMTLFFGDRVIEMMEQNFTQIKAVDFEKLDEGNARRRIWAANIEGIRQFPILGAGLGSHREVYWLWFNHPHDGKEYGHAESGPLQVGLETGLTGLGIVLLLWLVVGLWCAQGIWNSSTPRTSGAAAVVSAGLLVSVVHSFSDYVWYVPACMNIVLLYAVCAWRLSLMRFSEATPDVRTQGLGAWSLSRLAWVAATPCFLILGAWMVLEKLPEVAAAPHWNEYMALTLNSEEMAEDDLESGETMLRRRIELAIDAANANPRAHRPQLHAGLACLKLYMFDQQEHRSNMPLAQLRDAARASFTAYEEMSRWLDQPGVMGEGRRHLEQALVHFRESLKGCPLQPRPYLELADLIWLEGDSPEEERRLIRQAVAVRPYDARSQFALGSRHWIEGEQTEALGHWQEAFRLDPVYRGQLVQVLSGYVPCSFFLDNFDADKATLIQLRTAYAQSEDREEYRRLIDALAKSCVRDAMNAQGLQAERDWLLAHRCFDELDARKSAYHAAKEALAVNPFSFKAHQTFGLWLLRHRQYEEAVEHLTWCARRQPDSPGLRQATERAMVELQRSRGGRTGSIAEQPQERLIR